MTSTEFNQIQATLPRQKKIILARWKKPAGLLNQPALRKGRGDQATGVLRPARSFGALRQPKTCASSSMP